MPNPKHSKRIDYSKGLQDYVDYFPKHATAEADEGIRIMEECLRFWE